MVKNTVKHFDNDRQLISMISENVSGKKCDTNP